MMKRLNTIETIKDRYNPLPEITAKVFILTVLAFFMSSLVSTLGSIVDGFIIGHTMQTTDIGAMSLTSPIWLIASVITSILSTGSQPLCTLELGRGNKEKAVKIFAMTVTAGTGLTLILSVFILLGSGVVCRLLGVAPSMPEYVSCRAYLAGIAIGLPAMAAGNMISTGVNLEGARRWVMRSAAAITVSNILLDLLVVLLHGNLFMMGLTTSFSYYFGMAVYLLYYRRHKDALLRPYICPVSFSILSSAVMRGLPLGVSRITALSRSVYLNHLLAASATSYGAAAYNVQIQTSYLTSALFVSVARTMSMILCLYYAEENRKGMQYTAAIALGSEIFFGLILTFLLRSGNVAEALSWFFLGEYGETHIIANIALYCFAIGLLGQALSVLFATYLQSVGRPMLSNLVYILSDTVFVIIFVSRRLSRIPAGISDAIRCGAIFQSVSYAQIFMLAIIPVLFLIANLDPRKRPASILDKVLLLPKGYGISPENELQGSPRTLKQVTAFSEKAYDFCLHQNAGRREAYYVSLAAEEMGANILKHGFRKDSGYHAMELRVIKKKDALFLRIRDNSHIFDPVRKMASIADIQDPSRYIGLKMVMRMASDVVYTSTLNMNNLLIRIDLPEEKTTEQTQ